MAGEGDGVSVPMSKASFFTCFMLRMQTNEPVTMSETDTRSAVDDTRLVASRPGAGFATTASLALMSLAKIM